MKYELQSWSQKNFDNYLLFNPRSSKEKVEVYKKVFEDYFAFTSKSVLSSQSLFGILTSGSTARGMDDFKIIVLTSAAIEASAMAVNNYIGVTSKDVWGLALPTFHIGGLSILARAGLTGSEVIPYQGEWNPTSFALFLNRHSITLTSLVPTQIFDLVQAKIICPISLRVVFVGGGHLNANIFEAAKKLGWPIITTFGMTELSSQVACSKFESGGSSSEELFVLPHVEVQLDSEQKLMLRSKAQLTAQINYQDSKVQVQEFTPQDWFKTEDIANLFFDESNSIRIEPLGRGSDFLKIKGENVNLKALRDVWDRVTAEFTISAAETNAVGEVKGETLTQGPKFASYLFAIPEERDGAKIGIAIEVSGAEKNKIELKSFNAETQKMLQHLLKTYNEKVMPFERVLEFSFVSQIPRSELGKVLISKLIQQTKKGIQSENN